jgi:5-methylthioadenosine/S-adenosylhomocysteine deaminase
MEVTGSPPDLGREPDRFEQAYQSGVVAEVGSAALAAAGPDGPSAAPVETVALRGCVLTPDGPLDDGYVVVDLDGRIEAVQAQRPEAVRVHQTDGVILPGLIDLHGHPEFNVFAAWEPPRSFTNRYQWRASDVYQALVRDPQNRLLEALPPGTELRYAEIRALVAGTTAIQGASGKTRSADEALVRNVDLRVFGEHKARAMIDLPSAGSRDLERLRQIVTAIGAGEVTAFYLHLAEGTPDDQRSQREFGRLVDLGALTPATVVIHGCALTRDQLGQVADAGAKLVWSPQSNLRLYGATTRAADALELGVPVGLGADWLPSGSTSLLAELKVAARVLAAQGREPAPRQLVEMVTATAARIAGLGDHLGTLEPGRPADVLVLERHHQDPYENVLAADPSWVELVLVGGDLSYGRADWVGELAAGADRLEPLLAWGKRMLLDTSFQVRPDGSPPPTLAELRAALVAQYPQVGPIFA